MKKIRIALTKGRLEQKTVELFKKIGYDVSQLENKGRKLILQMPPLDIEVVLAKSGDVITYVEHGVCDIGVVGKDTIAESEGRFYEVLDLKFGACRFALAGLKDKDFYSGFSHKIVATKYPKTAAAFLEKKNMDVEIIKIDGSVELAPVLGLADAIVDIVETGATLAENGLVIYDEIMPISARLIVNPASMKIKTEEIQRFIEDIKSVI